MQTGKPARRQWVLVLTCLGALAVAGTLGYRLGLEEWSIRQLTSPDPAVRADAARRLAELDSSRAILAIARAGAEAGEDLDGLEAAEATPFFVALERIVSAPDRERLHEALKDPNEAVKHWAMVKLGDLPPDDTTFERLSELVTSGLDSPNPTGWLAAMKTLRKLDVYGRQTASMVASKIAALKSGTVESALVYLYMGAMPLGPNIKGAISDIVTVLKQPSESGASNPYRSGGLDYLDDSAHLELLTHVVSRGEEERRRTLSLAGVRAPHDPRLRDALIRGLGEQDPGFRAYCVICLAEAPRDVRGPAMPALTAMLVDSHPDVRAAAGLALSKLNAVDAAVVKAILSHAGGDENGVFSGGRYLHDLLEALSSWRADPIEFVRQFHAEAVAKENRVEVLRSAGVLLATGNASAEMIEVLAHAVLTSAGHERGEALFWLASSPSSVVDVHQRLRSALPSLHLRESAVNAGDRWTSRQILLLRMGLATVAETLADPGRLGSWVNAARGAGLPQPLPPELLPEVRAILVSHPDPRVRVEAYALVTGVRGAPRDIAQCFLDGLEDPSRLVRDAALGHLWRARLRGQGLADLVEPHAASRRVSTAVVFATLETLGAESVASLLRLLDHAEPDIRTWAAWTLGRLHEDAAPAVQALIRVLNEDPDAITRWNAAEALGRIGYAAAALPALERLESSDDPMLRRYAAGAVQSLRRPE